MSVASLAGYLANGGQSTYKAITLENETALTAVETLTVLFGIGDIILPTGTYLVTTFIYLQSYDADGTEAGIIGTAQVIVGYVPAGEDQKIINNQIYTGTGTSELFIQTSGIFVSDGAGSLVVSANVLTAQDGATQYNLKLAANLSPQVQIVKIA